MKLYQIVVGTGILSTHVGRVVFDRSYEWYKALVEVGDVSPLKDFVRTKTVVVDVGANVGFFTLRFANWVRDGGYVIAIEPEKVNIVRLKRAILKRGCEKVVQLVEGVAAEADGVLRLQVNPMHPGDHKIAEDGIAVQAYTVDSLLSVRDWPDVSLVKIDVQGAEYRVLVGMRKTLQRFRPAIFIEMDDSGLRGMGSSAMNVFRLLQEYGYQIFRIQDGEVTAPLAETEALDLCVGGKYADFLLLSVTK